MGSEQQFCLRWNNFQHSLLTSLPQLLDADDLTDVTLCAGGKSVKAHRVVLSACSHYFKELFREMQPFHHPVIVLPQTSYSDVCALVSFMYSGEVNIYQEQLPSLLAAAAALHIRGLAEVPHSTAVTARTEAPKSPPSKRAKVSPISSTPVSSTSSSSGGSSGGAPSSTPLSTPASSEPQNLATSLKPLDLGDSPRFEGQMKEEEGRTDSGESSALDCSDPLPLTMHPDTGPFGHSTSDDSHGSEADIPEKLQTSPALAHPLSFLPSSSIFSPLTSLARNKLFATCHICGKSLSNQYNLRVHLETHQNLNYSCSLCAHVSRSRDALRKHIAYKHTVTPRKTNSNSPEEKVSDLKLNNNSQQTSC